MAASVEEIHLERFAELCKRSVARRARDLRAATSSAPCTIDTRSGEARGGEERSRRAGTNPLAHTTAAPMTIKEDRIFILLEQLHVRLHGIHAGDYVDASTTLRSLAQRESELLSRKKTMLSLSKVMIKLSDT